MSIKRTSAVWERSMHKGSALLLLLAIADNADDNGLAWPGIAHLAGKTRLGERAVKNILKRVEVTRELLVYRRLGQVNHYIVTPGLSQEEFQQAIIRLATLVKVPVESMTSESFAPVIEDSPGGESAITTTSDREITRSVIEPSIEPSDSISGASPDTIVINIRKVNGQRPPYDVYIGRVMPRAKLDASIWANPYKVKDFSSDPKQAHQLAVTRYEEWLHRPAQFDLLQQIPDLVGQRLGCWCHGPDETEPACHGDVLARYANAYRDGDWTPPTRRAAEHITIIDAWWFSVPFAYRTDTRGINPSYERYVRTAKRIIEAGYTAEDVARCVLHHYAGAYWPGKMMELEFLERNLKAWKSGDNQDDKPKAKRSHGARQNDSGTTRRNARPDGALPDQQTEDDRAATREQLRQLRNAERSKTPARH